VNAWVLRRGSACRFLASVVQRGLRENDAGRRGARCGLGFGLGHQLPAQAIHEFAGEKIHFGFRIRKARFIVTARLDKVYQAVGPGGHGERIGVFHQGISRSVVRPDNIDEAAE